MMTLREKIGQMILIGFNGTELNPQHELVQAIQNKEVGGVILFDIDYHTRKPGKNIVNTAQTSRLISEIKSYALGQAPLFISVDYEGGVVNRLASLESSPELFSAKALSSMGKDAAKRQAALMARTLRELGFNVDFAPVIDVDVDSNNPIIGKLGRSYSSDPTIVAEYAALFIEALHAEGIMGCYKHFPGHGSSQSDSHLGFVDCSETWVPSELLPYQILLKEHAFQDFIMTAHIINRALDPSGLPATLSRPILTDLLRSELQYQGIIITDDMQMQAISDHFDPIEAVTLAINAGADMLIFGNQLSHQPINAGTVVSWIEEQVKAGAIPIELIEQASQRILATKARLT